MENGGEMPPLLSFMSQWRKMKVAKETRQYIPKGVSQESRPTRWERAGRPGIVSWATQSSELGNSAR